MIKPFMVYVLAIIGVPVLLIAMSDNEYGYYQFLRVAVTVAAGTMTYYFYERESSLMAMLFGYIAILFNPIFPIGLDREVWIVIDLVTALAFASGVVYAFMIRKVDPL